MNLFIQPNTDVILNICDQPLISSDTRIVEYEIARAASRTFKLLVVASTIAISSASCLIIGMGISNTKVVTAGAIMCISNLCLVSLIVFRLRKESALANQSLQ